MLDGNGHCGFPVKRHPASHHFIHDNPKGINVAFPIYKAIPCLFRGRIVDGAHHLRIDGVGIGYPGNAKIRHLYLAFRGNDNILRLNVPMDDMLIVGCFNPPAHLDGNADCFLKGKLPLFFNIHFKGDALHIFHNNIMDGILAPYIINIYNIWMLQPSRGLGFRAELRYEIHVLGKFRLQYLYPYKTPQGMVLCLIDVRHSPGPYFPYNFISVCKIDSLS